jgi:hypothetical protein
MFGHLAVLLGADARALVALVRVGTGNGIGRGAELGPQRIARRASAVATIRFAFFAVSATTNATAPGGGASRAPAPAPALISPTPGD